MPVVSFPVTGGSQLHPSKDVNYQKRINVFSSISGAFGRGDTTNNNLVLMPSAGLAVLSNTGSNGFVKIITLNDTYSFIICNETVYIHTFDAGSLSSSLTSIGTLVGVGDTKRLRWANNRSQIMLVNGIANWGYIIDYTLNTVTKITDTDFLGGTTVVQMDSYFVVNNPNSQIMQVSAQNDGLIWNGLDIASAESKADNLIGLAVDKGELLAIGARTIEFWYDAGNPTGFPFSKRPGEYYDLGCSANGSILNIDNTVLLLDHRRYIIALTSDNGVQPVSTDSWIKDEFLSYGDVSDAYAYEFQDAGQLMYCLVFPSVQKTWCYDLTTQEFHERAYWSPGGVEFSQHRVGSCQKYSQHYIAGDIDNGNVYLYSSNYLDDNGDTIRRLFSLSHLHSFDNLITINSVYLHGEFGTIPDLTRDPQFMLRFSSDGGYTWSNEIETSVGKTGEYNRRVKWYRLGTEREWLYEYSMYEKLRFSITEMGIDMEVCNV